jgi:hypothetical protein
MLRDRVHTSKQKSCLPVAECRLQKILTGKTDLAEAYPVKRPPSAAYNFPGPLSMYLKAGFATNRDAGWYIVVRKSLDHTT